MSWGHPCFRGRCATPGFDIEPLRGIGGLTLDEVSYVTDMARRIAALLLLQPALDANYRAVKASTYPWPTETITS